MARVTRDTNSGLQLTGELASSVSWVPNPDKLELAPKGENTYYFRHGQMLERWPVLTDGWAEAVEVTRLAQVDRTPGAATFGR
jgi:hypothetical protein